ncbi:hypothetical protein RRG08_031304 [Elysia crispata]|uniref:Uncharacterized protein n=1 Tax=Elysia crispata TaxID=231223 RepID=A0AAE1BF88_9GAST|nr:hypothetical protein RRG08_031304 [Elysia crispata]
MKCNEGNNPLQTGLALLQSWWWVKLTSDNPKRKDSNPRRDYVIRISVRNDLGGQELTRLPLYSGDLQGRAATIRSPSHGLAELIPLHVMPGLVWVRGTPDMACHMSWHA